PPRPTQKGMSPSPEGRADVPPLPAGRGRPQPGEGSPAPARSIVLFATGAAIAVLGIAINAVVLARVIEPRYYPLVADTSQVAGSTPIRFGSDLDLVQYQVTPARVAPGDTVDVDLFWRARQTPTRNWA